MHVNVAIVGLDRTSASLGLALKRYQKQPDAQHSFNVIGSDARGTAMKAAHKLGAVDNYHRQLLKAADDANLIVLNTPISRAEETFSRLGPAIKPGAVVLDLSELKASSIEWAGRTFPKNESGQLLAYLVGITPMINVAALYSGEMDAEHARDDLFDGGEVLIMPDASCPSEAIALAEDIVRLAGGKPRFMDPHEHDGLIAATEELPALLGTALFYMLSQSEGWTELRRMINPTLALATHTLRTRSPQDQRTLFTHNRDNIARHLESLIGVLDQVRDLLTENFDEEALDVLLTRTQNEWDRWDVKRHSGEWDERSQVDSMPGPLGSFGGFLTLNRRKNNDDKTDED